MAGQELDPSDPWIVWLGFLRVGLPNKTNWLSLGYLPSVSIVFAHHDRMVKHCTVSDFILLVWQQKKHPSADKTEVTPIYLMHFTFTSSLLARVGNFLSKVINLTLPVTLVESKPSELKPSLCVQLHNNKRTSNSFHENNHFKTYEVLFQFRQFGMIAFQSRLISIPILQRNVTGLNFHLFQLK